MKCDNRYDNRLKRLLKRSDIVLINNYKCGYSSSNLLEAQTVLRLLPEDSVIFFYRNVFFRTISTFINWCITDDRYRRELDWLFRNMKTTLERSIYAEFLDALNSRAVSKAFEIYVDNLSLFYRMNNHTLPQVEILEYYEIAKPDHFIELENPGLFHQLTGIRFPHCDENRSDPGIKKELLEMLRSNQDLQRKIRTVYDDDIEFFRKQGVCVDAL